MILISFLGPVIAGILYVIVFQKAGFGGATLLICAGPVASVFLSLGLMGSMAFGGGAVIGVVLIGAILSLAPLLFLAFAAWPPGFPASPNVSTEK